MASPHIAVLEKLGARIERQRKALGLSQSALGELAGVGINFVSQIESGKPTAHIGKILDVMQALGLQFKLELGKSGIEVSDE